MDANFMKKGFYFLSALTYCMNCAFGCMSYGFRNWHCGL